MFEKLIAGNTAPAPSASLYCESPWVRDISVSSIVTEGRADMQRGTDRDTLINLYGNIDPQRLEDNVKKLIFSLKE